MTPSRSSRKLLWFFMVVVICGVIATGILTNITLRSIEKNLPNTLLSELNFLSFVLENLADVVTAAEIANTRPTPHNFERLLRRVDKTYDQVVNLRESFVFDNLVKASAFHAVVAPAVTDLQTWLSEGVSGFGPQTRTTAAIALVRIQEAYRTARSLTRQSRLTAQQIMERQRERLDRFLVGVNLLFVLTIIITLSMVYLLVRQHTLQNRELATQAELRNQGNLLNSLFDNVLLGITVWNDKGELQLSNRGFTEITGYTREEISTLDDWYPAAYPDPAYRDRVVSDWNSASSRPGAIREFRIACRNGEEKEIEFRGSFLPDGRALVTMADITDRKRAEDLIRESRKIEVRARKMESLGLLAGGVAHDLNNILSGIVSYPELLLMELPEDSPLREPILTMQHSGQRAAAIVMDLLTMARGVATAKAPVSLNRLVREYLDSPEHRKLTRDHVAIAVEISLDENLFNIHGSDVHILKVVMNLVSNAAEAIEGDGTITIATANRYIDRPFRGYDNCRAGEYAVLSVSDNGSGISPDDIDRIFEPFYTKKEMGRSGTGLGLAVVWNVVQNHDGYIDLQSDDGRTAFDMYFPVTRDKITAIDTRLPLETYRGHGETILVVDDINSQREIATRMLARLGYSAAAAASGEEAIEYLKAHPVDLLVLDMIMEPGISGRVTYEKILDFKPRQKAIIASGFAETSDVKSAQRMGAGGYVKKPFSLENLGLAVRAELNRAEK